MNMKQLIKQDPQTSAIRWQWIHFFSLSALSNCHITIMSLGEVEFESQLQIPSELPQKSILTASLVYLEPLVVSKSVLGMILYKKMERAWAGAGVRVRWTGIY